MERAESAFSEHGMGKRTGSGKKRRGRGGPRVVTGHPSVALGPEEFRRRFFARFQGEAFAQVGEELERVHEAAWKAYQEGDKAPHTRRAGRSFADPEAELSVEWLATRDAIAAAKRRHEDRKLPSRVLLVNGAARSDQTCPGELSKTWRIAKIAEKVFDEERVHVDFLDLGRIVAERDLVIHPCKTCVSTAMPLCHWPCSCYPNHSLGQVNDWMSELYPRWVEAHGVMIVCPVNWYQSPSVLKLMMDRLVCADGGNPDPTTTGGKDPVRAKRLELKGWHYPKHLAGRVFSVVVHGDAAGPEGLERNLTSWLEDMGLVRASPDATLARYVGYWRPYATSHDDLDADRDFRAEVAHAARTLAGAIRRMRAGELGAPDEGGAPPRRK
jgi:multimeric flavodoxin WrbA